MKQSKNDKKTAAEKEPEAKKKPAVTLNPNPRANANIPDDKKKESSKKDGVGSEITDGEAG